MRDGGAVSPRVTDLSRVGSPSKNCPKDAAPGSQVAYPDMRVQSNPPTSSKRSNVDAGASGSMMRPTRCPWTSSTARSACAYVLNHIPVAVPASRPSNFALRPDPRRGPTALPQGPMRGGGRVRPAAPRETRQIDEFRTVYSTYPHHPVATGRAAGLILLVSPSCCRCPSSGYPGTS